MLFNRTISGYELMRLVLIIKNSSRYNQYIDCFRGIILTQAILVVIKCQYYDFWHETKNRSRNFP